MTIPPVHGGLRGQKVVRLTEGLSRRWTHTDIDQVRSTLASGTTIEDIALQLHREVAEVLSLARQLRMKVPRAPQS